MHQRQRLSDAFFDIRNIGQYVFCERATKRSVNFRAFSNRTEFYFCDKLRASIEKLAGRSCSIVGR